MNNLEDFKNISWSEEKEEEEAAAAAAAAAAATAIGASTVNDVVQHQRGGLLQLPAHLMNQTKENYQIDSIKRNKPKGFRVRNLKFQKFSYFL